MDSEKSFLITKSIINNSSGVAAIAIAMAEIVNEEVEKNWLCNWR